MKKEQHSRRKSESIPYSIAAANVVEFVVQNIFQFRWIILKTGRWQQNGWPNPAEGCGRSSPGKNQQPGTSGLELLREDCKPLCDANRRLSGETEHPPEVAPLLQKEEDQIT
jgi:hypothetical protein